MADSIDREKAKILRSKGLSINEIANLLGKGKTTVSYWCKDVQLTKSQIQRLVNKSKNDGIKSIINNSKVAQEKRKSDIKKYSLLGKNDIGLISKRDLFILGLALYWGEGYKKGNDEFGFTNSDPTIIKLIIKWLKEIYNIDKNNFILRVSINQTHINREKEVITFWKKLTKTKEIQFTKTSFIKSIPHKKYLNHNNYYGTLRLKVRSGANLRRRIIGSLKYIGDSI